MLYFVFPLLVLIFVLCVWSSLIRFICVLGCFTLDLCCLGFSGFLDLGDYFLPHFRKVFNNYLLKYFLMAFLIVFFFWDSYDLNIGAFNIVPEVSEVVLISFNSFFFCPLCFIYFYSTILSSTSLILSSASVILLLVLSRVFLISFIALFIIDWLFFISSRSLLSISCTSQSLAPDYLTVTPFWFLDFGSFLLSLFWIIFQVDSLSPPLWFDLVGFYHGPLPTEYFSVFSSCLDCCISGGLSVFWQFVVPLNCGSSSLWVGLDEWLFKVSCLGKLVSMIWWVELDLFPLECNEVSSSEFWDVYGFDVTLGSLYIEAQGYVPVLLDNLLGMSCSWSCWLLGGAWFQCEVWRLLDALLSINVPWSQEFSGVLRFCA